MTIIAACVWTKAEQDVTSELRRMGFQAYYPQETMERLVMGRKRKFRRPAVPGYVFIQCEPHEVGIVAAVSGIYAFARGVSSDPKPASIPPEQLACVFLAELFGELDYTRSPASWKPARGERVRVKAGLFKGYIGRILSLSKRKAMLDMEKGGRMEVEAVELEAAA